MYVINHNINTHTLTYSSWHCAASLLCTVNVIMNTNVKNGLRWITSVSSDKLSLLIIVIIFFSIIIIIIIVHLG